MDIDKLLAKFFSGDLSDTEFAELKEWIESSPSNRRLFDLKNEIWQQSSFRNKADFYQTDKSWAEIAHELGINGRKKLIIFHKTKYAALIAAASLVFLVACGALIYQFTNQKSIDRLVSAVTVVKAANGQKSHIILPDSTEVILNSDSKLEYNGLYNFKQRAVVLAGEAYFNVRTNPDKPFEVHVNDMTVVATGTKFNISFFQGENRTEATLVEGSVSVFIDNQKPVMLKEGQQVVRIAGSDNILVRDVITDVYTGWTENKLRFDDTPFEEVIIKLERKYNVDIEVISNELNGLKYTGTFIDESVEEVMNMLSLVSPMNFKISYRTSETDKVYKQPKIFVWHK